MDVIAWHTGSAHPRLHTDFDAMGWIPHPHCHTLPRVNPRIHNTLPTRTTRKPPNLEHAGLCLSYLQENTLPSAGSFASRVGQAMLLAPLVAIRALGAAARNLLQKELSPAGDHSSVADVRHPPLLHHPIRLAVCRSPFRATSVHHSHQLASDCRWG